MWFWDFALCFLFFELMAFVIVRMYLFFTEVRDSAFRRLILCIDCIGAITGRGDMWSAYIWNE